MATKTTTAKTSFYEVVFKGKPKAVRAFLSGLCLGLPGEQTFFFSYLDGIWHEGKAERLAELVRMRTIDCHVIVDSAVSDLLRRHKKKILADINLEIASHRRISSASMAFSFEAFAPRYNDEIMKVLKSLPAGLRLRGFKHHVNIDPTAKGVEMYAVAHHYEARGEGQVTGPIDQLVLFKQELDNYPLVKDEEIRLKLA